MRRGAGGAEQRDGHAGADRSGTGWAADGDDDVDGNPETYDFIWERSGQYPVGTPGPPTAATRPDGPAGTYRVTQARPPTSTRRRRAARVTCVAAIASVEAMNPAGESANPDPVSNAVRVDPPPAPAGGSVVHHRGSHGRPEHDAARDDHAAGAATRPATRSSGRQRRRRARRAQAPRSAATGTPTRTTRPTTRSGTRRTRCREGNRCYRVTVTATNLGGNSPAGTPTATVFVTNPPPPSGGSVTITRATPSP